MKHYSLLLLVFIIGSCSKTEPISDTPQTIIGLWQLHIMELKNEQTGEWKEWRDGMEGYLLYDASGHMALHLTTKGYQDTDLQFPNFNDTISIDALKHLTGSYVYVANYTIDTEQSIVEHQRLSHSNPAEWNKVVQRRFLFKIDTLVLTPVEQKNAGLRLKWVRQ